MPLFSLALLIVFWSSLGPGAALRRRRRGASGDMHSDLEGSTLSDYHQEYDPKKSNTKPAMYEVHLEQADGIVGKRSVNVTKVRMLGAVIPARVSNVDQRSLC